MTPRCVLLWSTNDDFLMMATRSLSSLALVLWARTKEEAMEKTANLRPSIVVIDAIPRIDTPAAARSLGGWSRGAKIILIVPTAGGTEAEVACDAAVLRSGVTSALISVIRGLLEHFSAVADGCGRGEKAIEL